jgi:histidine triad (HIT) family protein
MDCVFCKIISKDLNSEILYEDDKMIIIKDIYPKANIHYLAIPKKHIPTHMDIDDKDQELMGYIHLVINKFTKEKGINSYKLVMNCGYEAGQRVFHIHFHILSGQKFGEV